MGLHADKLFDQVSVSSSHSDADSRRPCADGNGEGIAQRNPTLVPWRGISITKSGLASKAKERFQTSHWYLRQATLCTHAVL